MANEKDHLILRYLQNRMLPEERQAFESWCNESGENRKLVDDLQQAWLLTGSKAATPDFQSEEEWQKLAHFLLPHREIPARALYPATYWFRIAASFLLLLAFSSILYYTFFSVKEVVIQTEGNTFSAVLPDGSEVWLNSGSRIVYDRDFKNRYIRLEGEAFFDVKRNPQKPFIISTGGANIKVLGTSFNVRAYRHEIQTKVFVVTGKVSLSRDAQSEGIVLIPGVTGILSSNGHLSKATGEDLNQLSWKTRQLVFKKTPMAGVIKTLRSYFKKDIAVKHDELLNCRFTSTFDDPTLEEVIETLQVTFDLKIERQRDTYMLDGSGCNRY
jgi:transmembrane sensor